MKIDSDITGKKSQRAHSVRYENDETGKPVSGSIDRIIYKENGPEDDIHSREIYIKCVSLAATTPPADIRKSLLRAGVAFKKERSAGSTISIGTSKASVDPNIELSTKAKDIALFRLGRHVEENMSRAIEIVEADKYARKTHVIKFGDLEIPATFEKDSNVKTRAKVNIDYQGFDHDYATSIQYTESLPRALHKITSDILHHIPETTDKAAIASVLQEHLTQTHAEILANADLEVSENAVLPHALAILTANEYFDQEIATEIINDQVANHGAYVEHVDGFATVHVEAQEPTRLWAGGVKAPEDADKIIARINIPEGNAITGLTEHYFWAGKKLNPDDPEEVIAKTNEIYVQKNVRIDLHPENAGETIGLVDAWAEAEIREYQGNKFIYVEGSIEDVTAQAVEAGLLPEYVDAELSRKAKPIQAAFKPHELNA